MVSLEHIIRDIGFEPLKTCTSDSSSVEDELKIVSNKDRNIKRSKHKEDKESSSKNSSEDDDSDYYGKKYKEICKKYFEKDSDCDGSNQMNALKLSDESSKPGIPHKNNLFQVDNKPFSTNKNISSKNTISSNSLLSTRNDLSSATTNTTYDDSLYIKESNDEDDVKNGNKKSKSNTECYNWLCHSIVPIKPLATKATNVAIKTQKSIFNFFVNNNEASKKNKILLRSDNSAFEVKNSQKDVLQSPLKLTSVSTLTSTTSNIFPKSGLSSNEVTNIKQVHSFPQISLPPNTFCEDVFLSCSSNCEEDNQKDSDDGDDDVFLIERFPIEETVDNKLSHKNTDFSSNVVNKDLANNVIEKVDENFRRNSTSYAPKILQAETTNNSSQNSNVSTEYSRSSFINKKNKNSYSSENNLMQAIRTGSNTIKKDHPAIEGVLNHNEINTLTRSSSLQQIHFSRLNSPETKINHVDKTINKTNNNTRMQNFLNYNITQKPEPKNKKLFGNNSKYKLPNYSVIQINRLKKKYNLNLSSSSSSFSSDHSSSSSLSSSFSSSSSSSLSRSSSLSFSSSSGEIFIRRSPDVSRRKSDSILQNNIAQNNRHEECKRINTYKTFHKSNKNEAFVTKKLPNLKKEPKSSRHSPKSLSTNLQRSIRNPLNTHKDAQKEHSTKENSTEKFISKEVLLICNNTIITPNKKKNRRVRKARRAHRVKRSITSLPKTSVPSVGNYTDYRIQKLVQNNKVINLYETSKPSAENSKVSKKENTSNDFKDKPDLKDCLPKSPTEKKFGNNQNSSRSNKRALRRHTTSITLEALLYTNPSSNIHCKKNNDISATFVTNNDSKKNCLVDKKVDSLKNTDVENIVKTNTSSIQIQLENNLLKSLKTIEEINKNNKEDITSIDKKIETIINDKMDSTNPVRTAPVSGTFDFIPVVDSNSSINEDKKITVNTNESILEQTEVKLPSLDKNSNPGEIVADLNTDTVIKSNANNITTSKTKMKEGKIVCLNTAKKPSRKALLPTQKPLQLTSEEIQKSIKQQRLQRQKLQNQPDSPQSPLKNDFSTSNPANQNIQSIETQGIQPDTTVSAWQDNEVFTSEYVDESPSANVVPNDEKLGDASSIPSLETTESTDVVKSIIAATNATQSKTINSLASIDKKSEIRRKNLSEVKSVDSENRYSSRKETPPKLQTGSFDSSGPAVMTRFDGKMTKIMSVRKPFTRLQQQQQLLQMGHPKQQFVDDDTMKQQPKTQGIEISQQNAEIATEKQETPMDTFVSSYVDTSFPHEDFSKNAQQISDKQNQQMKVGLPAESAQKPSIAARKFEESQNSQLQQLRQPMLLDSPTLKRKVILPQQMNAPQPTTMPHLPIQQTEPSIPHIQSTQPQQSSQRRSRSNTPIVKVTSKSFDETKNPQSCQPSPINETYKPTITKNASLPATISISSSSTEPVLSSVPTAKAIAKQTVPIQIKTSAAIHTTVNVPSTSTPLNSQPPTTTITTISSSDPPVSTPIVFQPGQKITYAKLKAYCAKEFSESPPKQQIYKQTQPEPNQLSINLQPHKPQSTSPTVNLKILQKSPQPLQQIQSQHENYAEEQKNNSSVVQANGGPLNMFQHVPRQQLHHQASLKITDRGRLPSRSPLRRAQTTNYGPNFRPLQFQQQPINDKQQSITQPLNRLTINTSSNKSVSPNMIQPVEISSASSQQQTPTPRIESKNNGLNKIPNEPIKISQPSAFTPVIQKNTPQIVSRPLVLSPPPQIKTSPMVTKIAAIPQITTKPLIVINSVEYIKMESKNIEKVSIFPSFYERLIRANFTINIGVQMQRAFVAQRVKMLFCEKPPVNIVETNRNINTQKQQDFPQQDTINSVVRQQQNMPIIETEDYNKNYASKRGSQQNSIGDGAKEWFEEVTENIYDDFDSSDLTTPILTTTDEDEKIEQPVLSTANTSGANVPNKSNLVRTSSAGSGGCGSSGSSGRVGYKVDRVMKTLGKKEDILLDLQEKRRQLDRRGLQLQSGSLVTEQLQQRKLSPNPSSTLRSASKSPKPLRTPKPLLSKEDASKISDNLNVKLKFGVDPDLVKMLKMRKMKVAPSSDEESTARTQEKTPKSRRTESKGMGERIKEMETLVGGNFFGALKNKGLSMLKAEVEEQQLKEEQLKQQQLLVQQQQIIEKQQLEEKRQKWQQQHQQRNQVEQQQYIHNKEQEGNVGYNKTCSSSEYMQQQQQLYDPTLTPGIMNSNIQPQFSSVNLPQQQSQQQQAYHNKQGDNFSLPPQSQNVRLRKPLQKAASQMSLNQPKNQQQQRQIQQLQQQQVIRRSKQQQQHQQPNQRRSMFPRLDSDDEFDKLVEINYKEIVHPSDDIGIGRSSGDNESFRQPLSQHLPFQSQPTQYNETKQLQQQQQQQNLQTQQQNFQTQQQQNFQTQQQPTEQPEVRLRQPLEVMDSGDEIGGRTVMDKANQWDVAIEQKINKQKQLQQLETQKKVKKHHHYQQPPQQLRKNVDASGMVPYQQQMQQHPQFNQQHPSQQHPQHLSQQQQQHHQPQHHLQHQQPQHFLQQQQPQYIHDYQQHQPQSQNQPQEIDGDGDELTKLSLAEKLNIFSKPTRKSRNPRRLTQPITMDDYDHVISGHMASPMANRKPREALSFVPDAIEDYGEEYLYYGDC